MPKYQNFITLFYWKMFHNTCITHNFLFMFIFEKVIRAENQWLSYLNPTTASASDNSSVIIVDTPMIIKMMSRLFTPYTKQSCSSTNHCHKHQQSETITVPEILKFHFFFAVI